MPTNAHWNWGKAIEDSTTSQGKDGQQTGSECALVFSAVESAKRRSVHEEGSQKTLVGLDDAAAQHLIMVIEDSGLSGAERSLGLMELNAKTG